MFITLVIVIDNSTNVPLERVLGACSTCQLLQHAIEYRLLL
jgi:hypothetical protein